MPLALVSKSLSGLEEKFCTPGWFALVARTVPLMQTYEPHDLVVTNINWDYQG